MMKYFINIILSKKVQILISILFFVVLFNNQITIIVMSILIFGILLDRGKFEFKLTTEVVLSILFFLYLIIRESFDLEKQGINYIIRLIPILILVVFLGSYKFQNRQIRFLTSSIILINYFFYSVALIFGIYLFIINNSNNPILGFSYYQWIVPIKINFHPPYWGFFIVLSFASILRSGKGHVQKLLFGIFSFFFLLLLSTRTAIFAMVCVIVLELVYNNSIKKRTKYFILLPILLTTILLSSSTSYLSKKIKNNSGVQERVKLWDATIDAFSENFLFGHSVPQGKEKIKYYYDLQYSKIDNYDPHNQFLYFAANYGFIGVILFLFILFYNKDYDLGFLMFLIIIIISFMTETILKRQMGIIIFALFFSLITNKNYKNITS